ncbi:MAG: membrane protein insertion efficiency factor YidD [Gammaproteobacteria bacterium]|jgi:hypothetical protein|nr:membrane protein insertion efficiency factor YidD [Chromatiales bacterium]MCP4926594.1 membrane protein insertion efficiency factor YidD [Gammaproteobacteria bacterium]MDP7153189.1 membrane protein insertion efficiency factor YidD [Gammaproteobacteria bacterium]MDP7296094.1 membrane protein insertion efficiency factor YidD [Gammaproteobacteria bacterium]MDP7418759.1 membrane protein insertion efficiency factor YidD [Gammaproteobacteria bacterium]
MPPGSVLVSNDHNCGHDHGPAAGPDNRRASLGVRAASGLITGYRRYISPFLGSRCRFHPTCSAYAGQAVTRFGVVRGVWLALRRIVRCHPFCDGGIDSVPEQFNWLGRDANRQE